MKYRKNINNIHDKSYKDLYSNKEVFLDLAKGMLNVPWTKDLKEDNLVLVDKGYILSDYEENESDIVYKANIDGKEVIFYILLEFQATVDYRMPLRLLFYINEIYREYTKNLNNKDKKNKKGFNVPAVIPIVLYNATRKWNVPRYFKDIVKNNELFGENIVNFKYELFDVNHQYTKEELIKNNSITSAIFLLDQKVEVLEFMDRIKAIALEFNKLTDNQKRILKHWIRNTKEETIANEAIKILDCEKEDVDEMVANNAFMIEEMKAKAEKVGIKEGLKEGIKAGKEIGKSEILINQLIKKFKELPDDYKKKLMNLPEKTIDEIGIQIFDMESIEELKKYF